MSDLIITRFNCTCIVRFRLLHIFLQVLNYHWQQCNTICMQYANCFSIREFISEMAGRNVSLTGETEITVQCTWLNVLFNVLHVPQPFEEESLCRLTG